MTARAGFKERQQTMGIITGVNATTATTIERHCADCSHYQTSDGGTGQCVHHTLGDL